MDNTLPASLSQLAALTTIVDQGDISLVTIPGCASLSPAERDAIYNEARYINLPLLKSTDTNEQKLGRQQHLVKVLTEKLRNITPPPDPEQEDEESRLLEASALKELEADKCPPCYPSHVEVPFIDVPISYSNIVSYWLSFGTGGVVLRTQLRDWKDFRIFQKRIRHFYRNKSFGTFVNNVIQRRQKHELDGEVHLLRDVAQQHQIDDWMEFQDYHLQRLERFEKELEVWKTKVFHAPITDSEFAWVPEKRLRACEYDVERQTILLHWIEQQRILMTTDASKPATNDDDEQYASTAASRPMSTVEGSMRWNQPDTVHENVEMTKHTRNCSGAQGLPSIVVTLQDANKVGKSLVAPSKQRSKKVSDDEILHPPGDDGRILSSEGIRKTRSGRISKRPTR